MYFVKSLLWGQEEADSLTTIKGSFFNNLFFVRFPDHHMIKISFSLQLYCRHTVWGSPCWFSFRARRLAARLVGKVYFRSRHSHLFITEDVGVEVVDCIRCDEGWYQSNGPDNQNDHIVRVWFPARGPVVWKQTFTYQSYSLDMLHKSCVLSYN